MPGAIVGGVAASLQGRPRLTQDVDTLVWLEEARWAEFLSKGKKLGFAPRRPDALAFARKTRVLLMRHRHTGTDVDIVLGGLSFEKEVVQRVHWVRVQGVRVPLATPEDLVIMKALARRARDVADIESLLDTHPTLDRRRIRRWVREFSRVLSMPDIESDLERILKARREKKSKTVARSKKR